MAETASVRSDSPTGMIARGRKAGATVILRNSGDDVIKLNHLPVVTTSLRGSDGRPLTRARVSKRLRPGEEVSAAVRIDLDPTMPPGEYRGRLKYDSVVDEPFSVFIPERTGVSLYPRSVTREGRAGEKVSLELVVENDGNVPVNLDKTKSMLLAEEQEVFKTFGSAVRRSAPEGHAKVLDALADNLKDVGVRPMLVKLISDDMTIQPGHTRKFTVEFKLPYSLHHNRYYYGYVFLAGIKLDATIHCIGGTQ